MWAPQGGAGLGGPGSFGARTRTTSASGDISLDDGVIRVNASGGNRILTLPDAAAAFNSATGVGSIFTMKKIDSSANMATYATVNGQLIDGGSTLSLTSQYEACAVQSNGGGWDVLFRG